MVKESFSAKEPLDQDWVDLILDALDSGISVQEIQSFLQGDKAQII